MNKYSRFIRCSKCNQSFKEINNINYICNYRLKYGKDKYINDEKVEESLLII